MWRDNTHQTYWKLEGYEHFKIIHLKVYLEQAGYHVKASSNRKQLVDALVRWQRGLLSYDACSSKELKTFCSQRNVKVSKKPLKKELVDCLEDEDEMATFDRFLDLPPELRNRIYSLHFDSIDTPLNLPQPPPITTVSRQVRQESLLLFYQTCRTIMSFHSDVSARTFGYRLSSKTQVSARLSTARLFSRAPSECLGNIRKLRLEGTVCPPQHWVRTAWEIDLGNGTNPVNVSPGMPKCDP